jgi:L-aspartate oxidase
VCGEAASTGLHGANRLASNGVLEALVFARACAADISTKVDPATAPPVALAFEGHGVAPDPDAVTQLRQTMTAHVGVRRTGAGLRAALEQIDALDAAHPDCPDFANMCATARLIAASALARRESRGAHWRDDFPDTDPAQAARSFITLDLVTERA